MSKIWFVIVTVLVALVSVVFVPGVVVGVLVVNALLAVLLVIAQLLTVVTRPWQIVAEKGTKDCPVSIHVPCHNEPFNVVKKTLDSLAGLDYGDYEVIVVDNNTHDPKIWQPTRDYCKKLGKKFKFLHWENLGGYKAGALNKALEYTNPEAEIIGIVDADYVVKSKFLQRGVGYFNDPTVAIVQFPQAYYNSDAKTVGLEEEYRSFFDNVLEQANSWNAVTSTGTLCLLRAKLFTADRLQWNEWCITEDAEISMHLHGLGYRGIFINEALGEGLMPFNYYSLQRQRERWVHGNMQIIRKDLLPTITNRHINWKQKLSFFTQLTTWFHPNYCPLVFLVWCLFIAIFWAPTANLQLISVISITTVIGFMFGKAVYFLLGLRRRNKLTFSSLFGAVLTHIGLTVTMSFTWLWALFSPQLPFNRTTKDPGEKITLYFPIDSVLISILLLISLATAVYGSEGWRIIAFLSVAISFIAGFGILFIVWQTKEAKKTANRLIA